VRIVTKKGYVLNDDEQPEQALTRKANAKAEFRRRLVRGMIRESYHADALALGLTPEEADAICVAWTLGQRAAREYRVAETESSSKAPKS
jgi:hypothetical protein